MYAVIRDGGRQYRVEEGTVLDVDLRSSSAGETIEFGDVLLVGGDGPLRMGTPGLPGAKVLAEVRGEAKGKKVEILNWRRRKSSRTHRGHRQRFTRVAVTKIVTGTEATDGA
jgi:large subunit ribosomal protein L21